MTVLKMDPSLCIHQELKGVVVFPVHQMGGDMLQSEMSRSPMETEEGR
jgi:hypothetical protein